MQNEELIKEKNSIKKINLEEYLVGRPKTYLEERLIDGTAEYYLVNENNYFYFYKETDYIDLIVNEKSPESIFDDENIMKDIFSFLKNNNYKKVHITLYKYKYPERQVKAIKYGFKEINGIKRGINEFIEYEKIL